MQGLTQIWPEHKYTVLNLLVLTHGHTLADENHALTPSSGIEANAMQMHTNSQTIGRCQPRPKRMVL